MLKIKKMKILCTICARGGSKEVKNKNIIKIKNTPLIKHTLFQALKSGIFDAIVVSTDSGKIKKIVGNRFAWFYRPKKLSNSKSPKLNAIRHALLKSEKRYSCKFDYIVDLDITAPLRSISDIKKSIKVFIKSNNNNMFSVSVAKKNPYFNLVEIKNKKIKLIKKSFFTCRQNAPLVYGMNGSIYIWKRSSLLRNKSLFGNKTSIYIMPEHKSFDIDSHTDLKIVKMLMKQKKN
jgi:CMP-N,N'-diacetyllegionaminic acid synthase